MPRKNNLKNVGQKYDTLLKIWQVKGFAFKSFWDVCQTPILALNLIS